jgi:tetrahydromethanopterin S-methyltransferase subunit D
MPFRFVHYIPALGFLGVLGGLGGSILYWSYRRVSASIGG